MIRSRHRHRVFSNLVLAAVLVAGTAVFAQNGTPESMGPEGAEMMALMEAWAKASTPGEMHDHLDRYEGEWTTEITLWMIPGQEPTTTNGTMSGEWVYGGRYMRTEHTSDMMGQPFHGTGIEGYDTVREVYTSTWYDNASTGIVNFEGQCADAGDADCSTMVYHGTQADPRTGEMTKTRVVVTFAGPDSFMFESFADTPAGETKTMEMTVQRK